MKNENLKLMKLTGDCENRHSCKANSRNFIEACEPASVAIAKCEGATATEEFKTCHYEEHSDEVIQKNLNLKFWIASLSLAMT